MYFHAHLQIVKIISTYYLFTSYTCNKMEFVSTNGSRYYIRTELLHSYFLSLLEDWCAIVLVLCSITVTYFGVVDGYRNWFLDSTTFFGLKLEKVFLEKHQKTRDTKRKVFLHH